MSCGRDRGCNPHRQPVAAISFTAGDRSEDMAGRRPYQQT